MHNTQFAYMGGTPIEFKAGDPIIGNCAHLEQSIYISVASGHLEGHFQQRLVKNPVGQIEPLSPEIQMSDDGKVETVFSSPLDVQTFQTGSLIEIRPGCAYAFKALSDGLLIEYSVSNAVGQSLFREAIGPITHQPIPDVITFELLKHSEAQKAQPPIIKAEDKAETFVEDKAETILKPKPVQSPEPIPQRYFYREEGTGILMALLCGFALMVIFALLVNSHNPLMFLLLLAAMLYVGYWTVLLGIQLYKKPFTLGIEKDGLIVNNLTFNGLFIKWEDIDRLQMGAISHGRYDVQGELVIEIIPKNPDAYGKYLNPLSRLWFDYCATHDTDYSMPTITIGQTSVTVDLNDLLAQLISTKLAYNYAKIAPQENA